jgi:hypothetical protein
MYKSEVGNMQTEVVYKIPVYSPKNREKFSGLIMVEAWNGEITKGYLFKEGKSFRTDVSINSKQVKPETVTCTAVDWQTCGIYNGQLIECHYTYTTTHCIDISDGGGNGGGGYPDVGGGGGILPLPDDPDRVFVNSDAPIVVSKNPGLNGTPIDIKKYTATFRDGKVASKYLVTVFVEQPVIGAHKMWAIKNGNIDAGHSFVMLEKINTDGTKVKQVIGFYPAKSPSPTNPEVPGIVVDNSGHDYNVSVTYPAVKQAFEIILDKLDNWATVNYNLNNKNCTDFAVEVGNQASQLHSTPYLVGYWTSSSGGLNPGYLGYGLLQQQSDWERTIKSFSTYQKAPIGDGLPK